MPNRRRLEGAAGLVEGVAQLLGRGRAAGGSTDGAAVDGERLAGLGGEVDRVAVGGVDDRAEQLAATAGVRRDHGRAGIGGQGSLQDRLGGGGVVESKDEHGGFLADPERLEAAAQLRGLEAPAQRPGQHVTGKAALGLTGDPAPHQLERDDGDRLLQDQALEVAEATGVADDHHPGLRGTAARRDHRVSEGATGDGGMGGDEGVAVGGVGERFLANRFHHLGGELSTEAATGEALAAAAEDRHGAADRRGDRRDDLLQAALFEDEPLEPALHGDAALQDLVLLVDETGEGFLGDRDERRRVGHLEEREVAFLGLLDQRFRQFVVTEAGAEAEAGEVAVDKQADEGALLGGGVERDPRGQHQLAAGEPRGRVLQLGDVHPAHRRLRRLRAGRELEIEFVEQALDGEHARAYGRTRSQASLSTPWRTSWISSNCSVSAISGGASWTTGSPRSSARQIRPRL